MTMVTKAPTVTARNLLEVNFSRIFRMLFPAVIFIPSLIISMPYRNIPIPPNKPVAIKNNEMLESLVSAPKRKELAVPSSKKKIAKRFEL